MPFPIHLLERAYQLINANQIENAELVLDAVVRVDPQNVEAWKTYLRIYQSQNDLDWLKERILKTRELSATAKTELVNYHLHLTQKLNGTKEANVWPDLFVPLLQDEMEEATTAEEMSIRYELVDVFDYPLKIAKKEIRVKSHRRAIYNPFALDIGGGVRKALSRSPIGRKIAAYIQKMIPLVNDLTKNPKETYLKFSGSPHFEKYVGVTLLTLFALGVRLAASGLFIGYVFLGMFIFGSARWLLNFGNDSVGQNRVYLHENKIILPEIKIVDSEQEKDSDK